MCGRFTVTATPNELFHRFGVSIMSNLAPRWNVAPTQLSPIIIAAGMTNDVEMARFGLQGVVPQKTIINARSETLTQKPTFKDAFAAQRCLIVASGWYEWKQPGAPYHIQLKSAEVMALAGLYFPKAKEKQFVIVTSEATGTLADIHHRTPLVLLSQDWQKWLQTEQSDARNLLSSVDSHHFNAYRVSPDVGNVRHDHAGLTAPYETPPAPVSDQPDLFS